jgi:hypothetical protein
MDERLAAVLAARDGVLSTADAARVGVTAVQLDGLRRSGELVRVRRGAYVLRSALVAASPEQRYCLRTKAVLRSRPALDAASHHAAVLLAGVDTYGVDLGLVDLVSAVSSTRVRSGVRTHPSSGLDVEVVDGWSRVSLASALCQVAGASGTVAGVASMDDALHDRRCTIGELSSAVLRLPEHQRGAAERAIALADPACESVGETRTRLLLRDLGFGVESQHVLADGRRFVGRADFLVEGLVVVEFDGLVKYGGQEGRHALAAEKARESAIVDLGYEVVRLVWADLANPAEVARRVRVALARAGRRVRLGA